MKFNEAKNIHVVGIGGIGISAIAKLLVLHGCEVTGSDVSDSEIVKDAAKAGVNTKIGHDAAHVGNVDLLIYSEAVPHDNPEREAARAKNIPEFSGAEALAELTKGKRLIAVAGTNGKSTTTALLGLILEAGGFDPTVIVGSKVSGFEFGNLRVGKSDWWVLEADEFQAKFLQLHPEIALITNIEEDHLDFYRDLDHIHETFQKFLDNVKEDGKIILNADDRACMNDLTHDRTLVKYGMQNVADYRTTDFTIQKGKQFFTIMHGGVATEYQINIPGRFNMMNALGAIAVACEIGVAADDIQKTCELFPGIWRRFERVGEQGGAIIISDYGHHPTSVRKTLEAAREFYSDRRVILVFQPHHYHRTKAFFERFVGAFAGADVLILSEVYAVAGRDEGGEIGSENLAQAARASGKIGEVYFSETIQKTEALVKKIIQPNDVIIIMGAGDIDVVARNLVT